MISHFFLVAMLPCVRTYWQRASVPGTGSSQPPRGPHVMHSRVVVGYRLIHAA
ncbi:hypothetical protein PVAP13_3NG054990 [Panicum virgatum]|uniref:Uncharacterized protein n=1 Tax=Panicum virgatum TaxID=38727 RepID=A0A8T0U5G9_PANVG|nr:hypothetical protein PVAP13_3NG054990 [Panicum virgatum]